MAQKLLTQGQMILCIKALCESFLLAFLDHELLVSFKLFTQKFCFLKSKDWLVKILLLKTGLSRSDSMSEIELQIRFFPNPILSL